METDTKLIIFIYETFILNHSEFTREEEAINFVGEERNKILDNISQYIDDDNLDSKTNLTDEELNALMFIYFDGKEKDYSFDKIKRDFIIKELLE